MKRILFVRDYIRPAGGHIKVSEYFEHCLDTSELDPYIYFTPSSFAAQGFQSIFGRVSSDRIVDRIAPEAYDILFLAGTDWGRIPNRDPGQPVINLIQHVRHAAPGSVLFGFLEHYAYRICVSRQVLKAIHRHANGPARTIPNGVPLAELGAAAGGPLADAAPLAADPGSQPSADGPTPRRLSVLVLTSKQPRLGAALGERLAADGVTVEVIEGWIPRSEFFGKLAAAEIFVGLPHDREGFYLPALEAMASGCAVVCTDAVGNRDFCLPGESCLQPRRRDLEDIVSCVRLLLSDPSVRSRTAAAGREIAARYDIRHERAAFHRFVDEMLSSSAPARPA